MSVLSNLEPRAVWEHFDAICAIPHGSGNTVALADHIAAWAKEKGIACVRDDAGNLRLWKAAAKGYEDHPPVILQAHIDMVAVKDADCLLDLNADGLDVFVENGWVGARGTSLGGDDGIGVAMAMAVLELPLPAPAVTVLLTNDEEIGMLGVTDMDLSAVTARRLINLDSEEEGVFTVSCAGGGKVKMTLPLDRVQPTGEAVTLTLDGLTGGHSGPEIHKGRANAIKLLAAAIKAGVQELGGCLASFDGGSKDNAIPTDATATLWVEDTAGWEAFCRRFAVEAQARFAQTDPALTLKLTAAKEAQPPLTAQSADALLALVADIPDGVQAKETFDDTLVRTSLNLGVLRTAADAAAITFSIRSSVCAERDALVDTLKTAAAAQNATVRVSGVYDPWEYRADSPLRDVMVDVYRTLAGKEPIVMGIHAGLECGPLCGKLPGLDAVSIGADMQAIHTTAERLSIDSTARIWTFLTTVLAQL